MRISYNGSRIMRSDYDKPHRCPGWAGAGWMYNKPENEVDCPSGSVGYRYEKRAWRFRTARCPECTTIALPVVLEWLEPKTWTLLGPRRLRSGYERAVFALPAPVRRVLPGWR